MTGARVVAVGVATVAGVVTGWVLAQRYLAGHRSALFSSTPRRRHAALGYLAGRPSPESVRLLRDYLAWERHPGLRRRAIRVVRQLELALA